MWRDGLIIVTKISLQLQQVIGIFIKRKKHKSCTYAWKKTRKK